MAAIASIKFDQADGSSSPAGEAHKAVLYIAPDLAKNVITVTNGDNTDVASWRIELLYNPPDSTLGAVPGTPVVLAQATSSTPSANFTIDDEGCYRIRLTVWSSGGLANIDIRNVGVANGRGFITPPYQKLPDPLPVPGSGISGYKPDELNFSGQLYGWLGDDGAGLHRDLFEFYDDLPTLEVAVTPFAAKARGEEPHYLVNLTTIGSDAVFNVPTATWRVGQRLRVSAYGSSAYKLTLNPPAGHTLNGSSSLEVKSSDTVTLIYVGSTRWVLAHGKYADFTVTSVSSTPFIASASAVLGEAPLYVVDMTAIGVAASFSLPTASWRTGQKVHVAVTGSTTYQATINPPAGHTINGSSSLRLRAPDTVTLVYLGSSSWALASGKYNDFVVGTVTSTPFTADAAVAALGEEVLYVVNLTTIGADAVFDLPTAAWRTGQKVRVSAFGSTSYKLTVNPPAGHTINGLSSLILKAPNTAILVYIGSSNWVVLGAKYDIYERSIVAGTEAVGVIGFQSIGSSALIDPANFPNCNSLATWAAVIETTDAADAAEIRLFNVTLGSAVAGSTLSTTNLTPTVVSSSVTLAAGPNLYEAQLRLATTGAPNQTTCRQAQLAISWLQP